MPIAKHMHRECELCIVLTHCVTKKKKKKSAIKYDMCAMRYTCVSF